MNASIGSTTVNQRRCLALMCPVNRTALQVHLPLLFERFAAVHQHLLIRDISGAALAYQVTDAHKHTHRIDIIGVISGKPRRSITAIRATGHANAIFISTILCHQVLNAIGQVVKFLSCRILKAFHSKVHTIARACPVIDISH